MNACPGYTAHCALMDCFIPALETAHIFRLQNSSFGAQRLAWKGSKITMREMGKFLETIFFIFGLLTQLYMVLAQTCFRQTCDQIITGNNFDIHIPKPFYCG